MYTLALHDALPIFGNVVTGDSSTSVTVAIGTNPGGGSLSGTLTRTVSAGKATFANLSVERAAGGYTLTGVSRQVYGSSTSASFNVAAGAATQLVFTF